MRVQRPPANPVPSCVPRAPRSALGITLLEVLVSVVLMSLGLLGLGAMLAVTLRESQENIKREHGVLVAQSIAELMSANHAGVLLNAYEGQVSASGAAMPAACSAPCDPMQKAAADRSYLAAVLADLGEAGMASIECSGAATPMVCDIQVRWRDLSDTDSSVFQSVDWRFVP